MSKNWRTTTLGKCCEIVSGATPRTGEADFWDGEIEWATPKDLSVLDGKFIERTGRRITGSGLASCSAQLLPAQSVLFSSRAPIGLVAINTVPMATNQGFKSLVPKPGQVDADFLYYWLRSRRKHLESLGNGATFKEVSKAVVSRVEIELPTLPEQRRIADILDKADAIRRKRNEAISLNDGLLRSTFLDMFGDPVSNPKGWEVVKLGSLAEDLRYGTSTKCGVNESDGALPVLRIPNVAKGEVDWDDLKYAELPKREVEKLAMRPGDILFVRSNGNPALIGRCAVYADERPALFASYLIRARIGADMPMARYIHGVLSAASYRRVLTAEARTTAGNYNISASALRDLNIPVPPRSLIDSYVVLERKIQNQQKLFRDAHGEARRLFESLVGQAFAGKMSQC